MMVICSGQTNKKPSDVRGKAVRLPSRHANMILKVRTFEFLAAHDGIIWVLTMDTGGH